MTRRRIKQIYRRPSQGVGERGYSLVVRPFTLQYALDALLINPLDHMCAHFAPFSVLCGMCSVEAFGFTE